MRLQELSHLHENHKNGTVSPSRCPECDRGGRWRRGVHFDHEKICMDSSHSTQIWCPDEVETYQCLTASRSKDD